MTYSIKFYKEYLTGTGMIPSDFDFSLPKFVDWYEDMIKDVDKMFMDYGKAMEDHVINDEERNHLITHIEDIIYNVLMIIKALLLRTGKFGEKTKPE